ncbi:MAG: hypothetical protein KME45_02960 [Stenomitos rutilans HA7619-LM2]|jgi:hypothetical protein|nr:hypothetical protein [Stenomitos rutilans HA7619-LM2]MBW4469344.1 hypothetical protein [Stenomitos rutilans HA7619-LM2]
MFRLTEEQKQGIKADALRECVLFAYAHGRITEGCGMDLLGIDRLGFRGLWLAFLAVNPDVETLD